MERTHARDVMLIDGMALETAGRYVALRKEIDSKLTEIENLGKILYTICLNDVNIDLNCLESFGSIISREANEIWMPLDQFTEPHYFELTLGKRKV